MKNVLKFSFLDYLKLSGSIHFKYAFILRGRFFLQNQNRSAYLGYVVLSFNPVNFHFNQIFNNKVEAKWKKYISAAVSVYFALSGFRQMPSNSGSIQNFLPVKL